MVDTAGELRSSNFRGKIDIVKIGSPIKILHLLLFAAGVSLVIITALCRPHEPSSPIPTLDELKAAFPGADKYIEHDKPFHHWIAENASGSVAGALFLTTDLPPDMRGYVGPVPVLAGMAEDGTLKRLVVMPNNETPYYMKRVEGSGFFERFSDRKVTGGFENVDTVSGATITSRAVVGDIAGASVLVAEKLFSIETPVETKTGGMVVNTIIFAFALTIALAARIRYRNKSLKWISWVLSIAVSGVWLAIPLSFAHISKVFEGYLPPPSNTTLVVLLLWTLATTVVWGPVFCGYACPFGAAQEIVWRAVPCRKWSISAGIGKWMRTFRWVVLFILVVAVFPIGISEAAGFEPYPYLFDNLHRLIFREQSASFSSGLVFAIWAYPIFVLAMSAKFKRFWCRVFCPTGACLSLLSVRRRLKGKSTEAESIGE